MITAQIIIYYVAPFQCYLLSTLAPFMGQNGMDRRKEFFMENWKCYVKEQNHWKKKILFSCEESFVSEKKRSHRKTRSTSLWWKYLVSLSLFIQGSKRYVVSDSCVTNHITVVIQFNRPHIQCQIFHQQGILLSATNHSPMNTRT